MVLATALPSDARSSAIASPSAFAADMSSALAAGNPPGWYASMPAASADEVLSTAVALARAWDRGADRPFRVAAGPDRRPNLAP